MGVFPITYRQDAGDVTVGGVRLCDLAAAYGTPLYVLDAATIRDMCAAYVTPLQAAYPNHMVVYAGKAGMSIRLLSFLKSCGLGVDVVSGAECLTALRAGIDPDKIVFHGNNKSLEELQLAVNAGVNIVVDHEQEMAMLSDIATALGRRVLVMLRLKPEIEAHTHDYIKTGQIDSKFGLDKDSVMALAAAYKAHAFIHILGLHSHIGSQIFDTEPYYDLVDRMVAHTQSLSQVLGRDVEVLNLGGGMGIQYTEQDDPPVVSALVAGMAEKLKSACQKAGIPLPKLVLEPGRSIVGVAGLTMYRVGAIKDIPGIKTYAFIDGGMADNIRPMLYQSQYTFGVAQRADATEHKTYAVAGRYCESGDVLSHTVSLPTLQVGDLIVVYGTGAYNYAMASNYNRVPRPAVVMVENGKSTLLVRRETMEDMLHFDVEA
jgi:diaminopimelate decarboxylase